MATARSHQEWLSSSDLSALQQQIVEAPLEGEVIVGGVAGSGKTSAAIYRAAYLCEHTARRSTESAVLFLCYNRTLARAVRQLVASFPSRVATRISVQTIHRWCWPYVRRQLPDYRVLSDDERTNLVHDAVRETRQILGKHEVFEFSPQRFLDEIRLIKGCDLIEPEAYLEQRLDRTGALPMEHCQIIFAVAETYNRLLRARKQIDFDDFAKIALGAVTATRHSARCDHVILDEAHDLSTTQIELGRRIARRSLLLIADQAQTIYRITRLPETLPSLEGYDIVLSESFRTTAQIFAHAQHLLPAQTRYNLPKRQGPAPRARTFRWIEEEAAFIAETSAALLQQGLAPNEIAILARQRDLLPPIAEALRRQSIPLHVEADGEQQETGVVATTIHSAKGREFEAVLIPGVAEGVFPRILPEMDRAAVGQELALARRQLYVAMTRARSYLWLTSSEGRPSRLFREIELPTEHDNARSAWD